MYLSPSTQFSYVLDIKHKYLNLVLIIVTNSIECLLCARHNPSSFARIHSLDPHTATCSS